LPKVDDHLADFPVDDPLESEGNGLARGSLRFRAPEGFGSHNMNTLADELRNFIEEPPTERIDCPGST
jgi:hypothetical protein